MKSTEQLPAIFFNSSSRRLLFLPCCDRVRKNAKLIREEGKSDGTKKGSYTCKKE